MTTGNSQTIHTVVGTGDAGYSGDGGPATSATLREPFMCAFDRAGNMFFCEARNHVVRRVDASTGHVTTVAGTGEVGYTGDGGPATAAAMNEPYSLEVDGDGNIYVVDRLNAAVRRVDGSQRDYHDGGRAPASRDIQETGVPATRPSCASRTTASWTDAAAC